MNTKILLLSCSLLALLFLPLAVQAQHAACCETGGTCIGVDTEEECKQEADGQRYYFAETGFCADGKCQASSENPTQIDPTQINGWDAATPVTSRAQFQPAESVKEIPDDEGAIGCCQDTRDSCHQTDDEDSCESGIWYQLATCAEGQCQPTAAGGDLQPVTIGWMNDNLCTSD